MLPNFMCIGAPKSGTTTLYEILKQHPDVAVSSFKEPGFFDNESNWERGSDWYDKTYFSGVKNEKMIGEFTPSYLGSANAPERILNTLGGDVKLILMLRNPVERAYSHFLHTQRDSFENLGFLEALSCEENRLEEGSDLASKFSYISSGMYFQQIENYLKFFNKSQLHIVVFEDFLNNKKEKVNELFKFLKLDLVDLDFDIHKNPAREARLVSLKKVMKEESLFKKLAKLLVPSFALRQKIRNYLHKMNNRNTTKKPLSKEEWLSCYSSYFETEIKELEILLSLDLSGWKKC